MGLRNLLTKDISFSSAVLHWNEPPLFRIRLRNDLVIRLAIIAGLWLASTGVFLLLFAINVNPPGPGTAFGLGLIGLGVGYLVLFARRKHVSGNCRIYSDRLHWGSMSAGLLTFQFNVADFEFADIDRCVIIPGKHIGHSFSVMLLLSDGGHCMVGVPSRVSLKQLAGILSKHGVEVQTAQRIPEAYRAPIPLPFGIATPIVGLLVLTLGFIADPRLRDNNPRRDFVRPEMPVVDMLPDLAPSFEGLGVPKDDTPPSDSPPSSAAPGSGAPLGVPIPDGSAFGPEFGPGFGPGLIPPGAGLPGMDPAQLPGNPGFGNPLANNPGSGTASELLGGSGGSPFRTESPTGEFLVGVSFRMGQWAGRERVGGLVPLFGASAESAVGDVIVGRPGYAVGAINVDADDLVNAVQLVFMRIGKDGSLDAEDSYTSDWIGVPDDDNVRTISDNGTPVIGLHGRGAAVLDAIGLVFRRSPQE
ncbi:MAG: hypothetical protein R3C19_23750 [Planctomycetaceae bacterium]